MADVRYSETWGLKLRSKVSGESRRIPLDIKAWNPQVVNEVSNPDGFFCGFSSSDVLSI